jgi:large subunit ribosomal protein L17
MRHKIAHRKLNRTTAHRKALLKNLTISLVKYGSIETTLPKAKELKAYFDKLVTVAKKDDFNAHRTIFAKLQDKNSVKKLIGEIAPEFKERNGGYTRVVKTRTRRGDAALMAKISLVSEE